VSEKRQEEEMLKMIKDWSLAKGRVEREISRKIDSATYASRFKDCQHK